MRDIKYYIMSAFLLIICINISWAHQTIQIQMVQINDYYSGNIIAPFAYRILPALIYHALFFGAANITTGLNDPLKSSYQIFQLFIDSLSLYFLFLIMKKIAASFCKRSDDDCWLVVFPLFLMIVFFGFFIVPNRSLFYPYDFMDMCLCAALCYLAIRTEKWVDIILPFAVFAASLTKETAPFFIGLFVVFRLRDRSTWIRSVSTVLLSIVTTVAARFVALHFAAEFAPGTISGGSFQVQSRYTYSQLMNPLFWFAISGMCSYLYVPILLIHNELDRTDYMILGLIVAWIAILSTVGIVRELRIFAPMSLLLFVILSRHVDQFIESLRVHPRIGT